MKNRLLPQAGLIALILFVSCNKKLAYFDFLERNKLDVQEINFDYFSTKTKINYTEGDNKINASANIRIRKDSIIWFSLTPALGIEAARGIITKDSLVVVDRLNKVYFVYTYASLSEKYNFNIDYQLLEAIFLGNPPRNIKENERVVREADYAMVEQKEGEVTFNNYISTKTSKLEKLSIVDLPTTNTLNITYSDFQVVDEFHIFPFQSLISLVYNKPGTAEAFNTQIEIEHNKAEVEDGKKMKFPFNIPQKYERK
ncbi:MAG: DUF4292 domain-containing protein [Imperialibacter sp.]|uniref:DUF4292 domain-containing protein n=1 Tax=Imperialibacter sp. TaxID=2038411 RepID=UPI0032F05DA2